MRVAEKSPDGAEIQLQGPIWAVRKTLNEWRALQEWTVIEEEIPSSVGFQPNRETE